MDQKSDENSLVWSRVDNAHKLSDLDDRWRNGTAACIGTALTKFTLARIAVLQHESDLREEVPMFSGEDEEGRTWQTFDNILADDPEKDVTSPVTVMSDVKMGLVSLFLGFADLAYASKLKNVRALAELSDVPCLEGRAARAVLAVVGGMRHLLAVHPLCRDAGYAKAFRAKFEAALDDRKNRVDPGSEDIAAVFLEFIKAVSWHVGTRAYEQGRLTLNWDTFRGMVASMEASVPEADGPAVRDALALMRDSVYWWRLSTSQEKAKKAPPKNAFAKKTVLAVEPASASLGRNASAPDTDGEAKPIEAAKPAVKPAAKPAAAATVKPVTKPVEMAKPATTKPAAKPAAAAKTAITKPASTKPVVAKAPVKTSPEGKSAGAGTKAPVKTGAGAKTASKTAAEEPGSDTRSSSGTHEVPEEDYEKMISELNVQ
jgi:hypothetical protein